MTSIDANEHNAGRLHGLLSDMVSAYAEKSHPVTFPHQLT